MFSWLKRMLGGGKKPDSSPPPPDDAPSTASAPPAGLTRELMDVVDAFLTQNPQHTVHGVHALVAAGAAELADSQTVLQACDRIEEHGYQYPLNPTLIRELKTREILPYLRWQAASTVSRDDYLNEHRISRLIHQFRDES